MKSCPFCGEEIQDAAIKCRYCGERLDGEGSVSVETAGGATEKQLLLMIDELKEQKTQVHEEQAKARSGRNWALVGILVGILLAVAVNGLAAEMFGGLLVMAGILAALTQGFRVGSKESEEKKLEDEISELRRKLAKS